MGINNKSLDIPIKTSYTFLVNCKNICFGGVSMQSIVGVNGTMELYNDRLVLKRGKLLGNFEKTTYLKDVIEVQLKKPGLTRATLIVSTALDHGGGNLNSTDANAIFLKSKQWDEGVDFKRLIEESVARIKDSEAGAYSAADEIAKFKKLFDDGVISEEEFSAKKKKLLGI